MVRPRRLICALLAALFLAGCTTQPRYPGHQDPDVFRPKQPVYPMPK